MSNLHLLALQIATASPYSSAPSAAAVALARPLGQSMHALHVLQAYVQPTEHLQLDPFCIELTGIQQQQVDAAQQLGPVLTQHHAWLQQRGMFEQGVAATAVTWTSWDLAVSGCER